MERSRATGPGKFQEAGENVLPRVEIRMDEDPGTDEKRRRNRKWNGTNATATNTSSKTEVPE